MEKIEALAKFLGIEDLDQIEETRYNTFQVNPHSKKIGDSPNQKLAKINLVKEALKRVGLDQEFVSSGDFKPDLYNDVSNLFYKHCEDLTKIGIHDLVNTLYFLCGGSIGQEFNRTPNNDNYIKLANEYRALFDDKTIEDTREEIEVSEGEYLVLTNSEADEAFEESIQSYIDDCVLPEIPEQYRSYFDCKAFAKDASMDGRGHNLASYDGEENEQDDFFIYRVN